MTREELLEMIELGEWQRLELKKACKEASKSALKTVSAFANTEGGHIIFGVTESAGKYEITGVDNVNVVQDSFLSLINDKDTISVKPNISHDSELIDGKRVLWFYIPEVSAREKPVFSHGTPYIREGAMTRKCRGDEIASFARNASENPYDVEGLYINAKEFYDRDTLMWYRKQVESANPDLDPKASDMDFLKDIGFLVEEKGEHLPTRAAVLILGKRRYISQRLQRLVVNLLFYSCSRGEESSDNGWVDREEVRCNLIDAWRAIKVFFDKHTDHPFEVDHRTLRRIDTLPGSAAFREATANFLIHQDYGDLRQPAVIQIFRDGVDFSNPGDAFDSRESLLTSGSKKIRNPSIATGFRRIGLSEQVGFGIKSIYRDWRKLGYMPPELTIDKSKGRFSIWFPRVALFGEKQQQEIDNIDIDITNAESAIYAFVLHKGSADLADIMGLTDRSRSEALELASNLISRDLLIKDVGKEPVFLLAAEANSFGITEKVGTGSVVAKIDRKKLKSDTDEYTTSNGSNFQDLTAPQKVIIENAEEAMSLTYFMNLVGFKNRGLFNINHIRPLIKDGFLEMTIPDFPTSSKQKYILTQKGRKLRKRLLDR